MTIYDKAVWQIDGGIPEDLVVSHFRTVFDWLNSHNLLSEEGLEELEDGIDECAVLHERLVTKEAAAFLDACYDQYLMAIAKDKYGIDHKGEELEKIYQNYRK